MRLLVYLRDGRTVYYIEGRGVLRQLMSDGPAHEQPSVPVIRGIWNPHTGEYVWRRGIRVRHIAHNTISVVEEGHPTEAIAPQGAGADEVPYPEPTMVEVGKGG